jgi:hypothetical protein
MEIGPKRAPESINEDKVKPRKSLERLYARGLISKSISKIYRFVKK